ncbi:MAG: histidine kinase dimerization/phospho-acceptor domain-containing protein, partial [Planctomycetota bacterium]
MDPSPTVTADCIVGWYPDVGLGNNAWRLPLLQPTFVRLLSRFSSDGAGQYSSASAARSHKQALQRWMADDPSLLMYAALRFSRTSRWRDHLCRIAHLPPDQHADARRLRIGILADWVNRSMEALFPVGPQWNSDVVANVDDVTMNKLLAQAGHTNPSQYMTSVVPWLEACNCQVGDEEARQWPLPQFDDNWLIQPETAPSQNDGEEPVQILARMIHQQKQNQALQHQFDSKLQSEKRLALKELVYGLTHEINNPLANIRTRCELLADDESDPARRSSLQRIIDQAMRAYEMLADAMFYANPSNPNRTNHSIDPLWQRTLAICKPLQEMFPESELRMRRIRQQTSQSGTGPSSPDETCDPIASTTVHVDADMYAAAVVAIVHNALQAVQPTGRVIVDYVLDQTIS